MTLKVGIIGAGDFSRVHIRAFQENPNTEITWLNRRNESKLREMAQKHKIKNVSTDYYDVLKDPDVDLVSILASDNMHREMALASFEAGKHVILEKPLARNLTESKDIIQAAEQSDKRFFVIMSERYIPFYKKTIDFVCSGKLGKPFLANWGMLFPFPERIFNENDWIATKEGAGGGIIIDPGCHALYFLEALLGKAVAISSVGHCIFGKKSGKEEDNAAHIIEFENEAIGVIAISFTNFANGGEKEPKYVLGTEGTIYLEMFSKKTMTICRKEGKPEVLTYEEKDGWTWFLQGLKDNIDDYILSIIENKEPMVSYQAAYSAMRIVEAAYKSIREKRRVELKEIT